MKLYLVDAENIYFSQIRNYFKEIISSYDNENYRSAMVMLYSTIICDLLLKLKELSDVYGLSRAAVLAGEENAEARTDDQPDHANHKDDNYRNPPACSNSGAQRLCSGNDGFDGGSGSLDRRLNACCSCFCGRTGGMRRSFSGFCRDLCGFLRRFCRCLRRFYGRPGGLLGGLDGFLRGLDRRFARRFCRLLDGLAAAVYRFDRLLRSIGRAAHPPHGVLRLLFRQVGSSSLKIVLCLGDILLGSFYTLAAGLI